MDDNPSSLAVPRLRQPKIVVVGSINMDLVVRCDRIPSPGETILGHTVNQISGGKGANQAVAAARAGADVQLIGCVGNDSFADILRTGLQQQNVDIQKVQTIDGNSGVAIIAVEKSGQNAITVVPGANYQVTVDDIRQSENQIRSADVLMVQLELPVPVVIEAIRVARDANVRVILDPAPAPLQLSDQLLNELLDVDLLCPNETEAAVLVGHPVTDFATAESAARWLSKRGVLNVAITMGDQGTLLMCQDQIHLLSAFDVDAVDTTAAGDAFAGALAVRWAQNDCSPRGLVAAVQFANAAGALAASKHGAQPSMATEEEIETLWNQR